MLDVEIYGNKEDGFLKSVSTGYYIVVLFFLARGSLGFVEAWGVFLGGGWKGGFWVYNVESWGLFFIER